VDSGNISMAKIKSKNTIVKIQPAKLIITPYALANLSDDLHNSSESFSHRKRVPISNYYLYSISIELGLKAAILSADCTKKKIGAMKKIGHDLEKLVNKHEETTNKQFFTSLERDAVCRINIYYKNKSLEYFTFEMKHQMLTAYKGLPKLKHLARASRKLNKLLRKNKNFLISETSDNPTSGIITFY
jgi:hypothetical protein